MLLQIISIRRFTHFLDPYEEARLMAAICTSSDRARLSEESKMRRLRRGRDFAYSLDLCVWRWRKLISNFQMPGGRASRLMRYPCRHQTISVVRAWLHRWHYNEQNTAAEMRPFDRGQALIVAGISDPLQTAILVELWDTDSEDDVDVTLARGLHLYQDPVATGWTWVVPTAAAYSDGYRAYWAQIRNGVPREEPDIAG